MPDLEAALTGDVRGLRVGIPKEYRLEGTPGEITRLWQDGVDWLEAVGCQIREISLPHTKYALPAYYIVNPAEASSNLARYDGMRYGLRVEGKDLIDTYARTRAAGFGTAVRRRIMIGTYVLSAGYYDAYYLKAQKVRTLIKHDFEQAFADVDVLLTPTTPGAAFAIGEKADDPVSMYLNDIFTVTANMSGLPGISIPAGLSAEGTPLGLQLIGRAFDEETLLTHDYSSTVLEAFELAAQDGKHLEVYVTEARPRHLGRKAARTLAEIDRIDTTLIVDGASGYYLGECDRVFLGMDCIVEDTYYNRVGTYPLAAAANDAGTPVTVSGSSAKLVDEGFRFENDFRDPSEVIREPPEGFDVKNPAYDATPTHLLD
jgi:hypothetical protein